MERNPVAEAAERRRSVRTYSSQAVTDQDLAALLRLTGRAPSAWNLQPWRFVVVRQADLKTQLQAVAYGQAQVGGASAVIVLYVDMEDALRRADAKLMPHFSAMSAEQREQWGARQAGIALGYLLLLAEGMGLATSPMLGFDPTRVRTLLDLPSMAPIVALIAVGYAATEGTPNSRIETDALTTWR